MIAKTSISGSTTYNKISEFWDEYDADEFGEQTEVEFDVDIRSQSRYYSLDSNLSLKLRNIARSRGISEETFLNIWAQEKVSQNIDAAR